MAPEQEATQEAARAQQASIGTAAATVSTLAIDHRQVTAAVFRQITLGDLVHPDSGDLYGKPWGRVNYCPPGECGTAEHLHVVWQEGGALWRATEYRPDYEADVYLSEQVKALLCTWAYQGCLLGAGWGGRPRYNYSDHSSTGQKIVGWHVGLPGFPDNYPITDWRVNALFLGTRGPRLERAVKIVEAMWPGGMPTMGHCQDGIAGELDRMKESWTRRSHTYRQLKDLPQLFIAV